MEKLKQGFNYQFYIRFKLLVGLNGAHSILLSPVDLLILLTNIRMHTHTHTHTHVQVHDHCKTLPSRPWRDFNTQNAQ